MLQFQKRLEQLQKLEAAGEGTGGQGSGTQDGKKEEGNSQPPPSENEGEGTDDQLEVEKLPPAAQKLIKSLRDENAKHRTKNKELGQGQEKLKKALVEAGIIENDEVEPEEKIKGLSAEVHGAQMRNALLEAALEHDVPKTSLKYFQFLITERLEALEDDGELSQEDIAAIAQEAKKVVGGSTSKGAGANSSAGTGKAPPAGGDGRVTQEQFDSMSILEKSDLYVKQPELYNQLFAASKISKMRRA
jgi:hypothetical protein